MKYIITKNNSILKIYADRGSLLECENGKNVIIINKKDIVKQANTIEELCDRYVVIQNLNNNKNVYTLKKFIERVKRNQTHCYEHDSYQDRLKYLLEYNKVYGAIWTDKGLIYVAKINEKEEVELL